MKYFAWALFCAALFAVIGVLLFISIPDGDSKFVRHVVLAPTSREYDCIAISAHGTKPSGYDLATSAWILISLNSDDKESKAVARLESIDQKKGILSTSHDTDPETIGNAFTPAAYHRWFESLGFDLTKPSLAAEANTLPGIVANVGCGSGCGIGADPALFNVLLDETTPAWKLMPRSSWVWLHEAFWTGLVCSWLTGLCFIAFHRRKPQAIQSPTNA
jgi:hypothetical protein